MSQKHMLVLLVLLFMASTSLAIAPKDPTKPIPPTLQEQQQTPQLDAYRPVRPIPKHKPPQLDAYRPQPKPKPKPPQLDSYNPPHKRRPPHVEEQHNTDTYVHKPPHHGPPNVGTTKEMPLKEQLNTNSHPKTKPGHADSTQPKPKPPQLDAYIPIYPNPKPKPPQLDGYHPIPTKPPHRGPPNVGTTKEMPLKEQLNTNSHPKPNPGHAHSTEPNSYRPKTHPIKKPPTIN